MVVPSRTIVRIILCPLRSDPALQRAVPLKLAVFPDNEEISVVAYHVLFVGGVEPWLSVELLVRPKVNSVF